MQAGALQEFDVVAAVAEKLFPEPVEVTAYAYGVPPVERFWLIPGKEGLRWIIPVDPGCGWPVLMQWLPYNRASRIKWTGLMAAYRTGCLGGIPRVRQIGFAGAAACCWQCLGAVPDSIVVPVIYIGTPGPERKAVATLIDSETGIRLGLTKVPIGPGATDRIQRESRLLDRLQEEKPEAGPRLLTECPRKLYIQEAIHGRPTGKNLTAAHTRFLSALHGQGRLTHLLEGAAQLQQELESSRGNLSNEVSERAIRTLDGLNNDSAVPTAWVHGDFVPWNILRRNSGSLVCVDWEHSKPNGAAFHDLFHFHYMQAYLFGTKHDLMSEMIANPFIATYLRELRIDPFEFRNWSYLYLIGSLLRQAHCGKRHHVAFLARNLSQQNAAK